MKPDNDLTTYYRCRPHMQSGDLIEWGSTSWIGKGIRYFTKRDVNHTSFVADLVRRILVDPESEPIQRKWILESVECGIDINLLSEELRHYKGAVYWLPLRPEHDALRPKLLEHALLYASKKYDWKALFLNAAKKVKLDADRLFCSEYCQQVYTDAGLIDRKYAIRPGEWGTLELHKERVRIL